MSATSLAIAAPIDSDLQSTQYIYSSGGRDELLDIAKESDRVGVLNKTGAMLLIEQLVQSGMTQRKAIAESASQLRGQRGCSASQLTKYWDLWRNGGHKPDVRGKRSGPYYAPRDWRMFLPNYHNGEQQSALRNAEFTRWVLQLHAETTREDATGNALHDRILDIWFAGDLVPGYGNIYEWCGSNGRPVPNDPIRRRMYYPSGWSSDNIRRMLPASMAARVYVQRGEHAAHSHWGDQLLRDRSRLMPFQMITFDDVEFDLRVIMPLPGGTAQIVRPEALFCLDVATGMILAKGVSGAYTRTADGDGGRAGTKRGLQQADMRFLLVSMLERYGLPLDWQMNVLLENASASLSTADKALTTELTGIRFEQTGLIRNKLIKSGFVEQGGMPWQKGWIEAWFRLLHCRINHLQGTIGRRYDLTDGHHAQAEKYALKAVTDALEQGIDINSLSLPILSLSDFHDLLDQYVMRLNWRTRHTLQGFEKVYEMQVGESWIRHDDPRASTLMTEGTQLHARMEAPIERAQRLMRGHRMQPLHPRVLLPLSMDKRPVTVRAERVTMQLERYGSEPLVFRDGESADKLAEWNGREKGLLGIIATDASCVHLFSNDSDLTYICSPRNVQRVDMTDEHAILERSGEVHRGRQSIRDEVADLLAPRERQYEEMRAHNDTVLGRTDVGNRIAAAAAPKTRLKTAAVDDIMHITLDRAGADTWEDQDGDLTDIM